ncbi:MAG: glycosyltransferase family 4 protein [Acetobacteraceae bacterium]|nr:glycosyltransferase family 4 protein [Acetobacteraceae bacterium]
MTLAPIDGPLRRVAILSRSLGLGGTERVTAFLAHAFAEAGWEVTVITLEDEPDVHALPTGIGRIRLALQKPSAHVLDGLANNLHRAWRLRRVLQDVRPDLVISLQMTVNCLALLASFGLRAPVVISDRVSPASNPLERGVWRWAVKLLYPRSARLVAVSAGVLAERSWMPQRKRLAIPNAVQLDHAPAAGDPILQPDAAPHILALGRLVPQKGFDVLLEAFGLLAARFPAWNLTIIGEGPERKALEAKARRLGLGGRAHLPGAAKAPGPLLRAAAEKGAIFAFPSRFEGFPNVLIEALAAGLPVVASDCPHGPREILEGGAHGLLVPPESPEALAEALASLMTDAARRADLARRARARAERYRPDRIAPLWLGLAEAVLAERRTAQG